MVAIRERGHPDTEYEKALGCTLLDIFLADFAVFD